MNNAVAISIKCVTYIITALQKLYLGGTVYSNSACTSDSLSKASDNAVNFHLFEKPSMYTCSYKLTPYLCYSLNRQGKASKHLVGSNPWYCYCWTRYDAYKTSHTQLQTYIHMHMHMPFMFCNLGQTLFVCENKTTFVFRVILGHTTGIISHLNPSCS